MAGWQNKVVDSARVVVGYGTSLAFDGSGNPAISYIGTNKDHDDVLKYARSTDGGVTWLPGNITTVAAEGMDDTTSLAFDGSGNPGISFPNDSPTDRLKYAHSTDGGVTWLPGNIETVAAEEVEGLHSLAFDGSNNPAISYSSEGDLKYAHRIGTIWNIEIVDSNIDEGDTSLAFDGSDNPSISYYDSEGDNLKYANFNGATWDKKTVDSAGCVGCHNSLAFDASGNPAISYYDFGNGDLKYAHRIGTTWNIETVDSEGNVGGDTSLAFDASGNPAISYYDLANYDLKYARFVPCQCDAGSPMGCISGTVTKVGTGEPLAGKTVQLKRVSPRILPVKTTVTDNDGCYRFSDLEDGTYRIKVSSCRGGGSKTRKITGGGKVNDVNFGCR